MKTEPNEVYSVGITRDGRTTLTIPTDGYSYVTLAMVPEECERLIRLLRATYTTETVEDEE